MMRRTALAAPSVLALSVLALSAAGAQAAPQDSDPSSWENQAVQACQAGNFDLLFEAFVFSPEVRRLQSATPVEQRSFTAPHEAVKGPTERPEDFAIGRVDYTYADPTSIRRWEAGEIATFATLEVQSSLQANGDMRVDYQPATFRPDDGEGESMVLLHKTGRPAAYVFEPSDGCWRLKQHLR